MILFSKDFLKFLYKYLKKYDLESGLLDRFMRIIRATVEKYVTHSQPFIELQMAELFENISDTYTFILYDYFFLIESNYTCISYNNNNNININEL